MVNKRKGEAGQPGNKGQWAAKERDELDVEIPSDLPPERVRVVGWQNAQLNEHFDATALMTPEEAAARDELIGEDEVFERISEVTRQLCSRRDARQHYDDVVGDTSLDIVKRIREASDEQRNIRAVTTRALVSRIAHGHLSHRLANGEVARSETRTAQKLLAQRIAEIEQTEHRHVGNAETKRLAQEIYESMPASRRPDRDFYTGNRHRRESYDVTDPDTGMTMRDTLSDGPFRAQSNHLDPTGELAVHEEVKPYEEAVDPSVMQSADLLWGLNPKSDYDITARDVQTYAYTALTQTLRLPPAATDSLPHRRALKARRTVLEHQDGAPGVAQDFLAGDRTEQTEALFAPFGEIDQERRESLATFLADNPHYGNDVWEAALRTANKERENFDPRTRLKVGADQ